MHVIDIVGGSDLGKTVHEHRSFYLRCVKSNETQEPPQFIKATNQFTDLIAPLGGNNRMAINIFD